MSNYQKSITRTIEDSLNLDSYRIPYEYTMLNYNANFIIIIPEITYNYSKNKEEFIVNKIKDKLKENNLFFYANFVDWDGDNYRIGVFTFDYKKALADKNCTLSAEALFKLKMKELELI